MIARRVSFSRRRAPAQAAFNDRGQRWQRCILRGVASLVLVFFLHPCLGENPTQLPELGGNGPSLFNSQQKAEIEQQVLREIRTSGAPLQDPLVENFVHDVIYRLIPYAPLDNHDVTTVLLNDPNVNAFAVPGGLIGVNGGLFLHAANQQEFAAVLAHELGHLVQHHFERQVERQKQSTPLALAGILGGIIVSAVTHSDAGIAAAMGSEAWNAQSMLKYSRMDEQEADRVGLHILADAGMNPRAMPKMFEALLRQSRIEGAQPPPFLMDHPLTQSRIADTENRADQYPRRHYPESLEYHLMRARMMVHFSNSPDRAVKQFRSQLSGQGKDPIEDAMHHYGLAVALIQAQQPAKAIPLLQNLLQSDNSRITYVVTLAEAQLAAKQPQQARKKLKHALNMNPDNYPIMWTLAKADLALQKPEAAARLLGHLSDNRPQDAKVWEMLAQANGQARDIVGAHRAQAEYQYLMGDARAAIVQLRQAMNEISDDSPMKEVIQQRLSEMQQYLNQHPQSMVQSNQGASD